MLLIDTDAADADNDCVMMVSCERICVRLSVRCCCCCCWFFLQLRLDLTVCVVGTDADADAAA